MLNIDQLHPTSASASQEGCQALGAIPCEFHDDVNAFLPGIRLCLAGFPSSEVLLQVERGLERVCQVSRAQHSTGCHCVLICGGRLLMQVQQFDSPALTSAFTISSTTVSTAFCEFGSRPGCIKPEYVLLRET